MGRVSLLEATKPQATQEYFSSKYSLKTIAGLAVEKEVCVIPLGLGQGIYKTAYHKVRAKANGKPNGGFKGWYDTNIICKSYLDDGTRVDEPAICCQLAQAEKDRVPDKEKSSERKIGFTNWVVHIPVLVLVNKLSDDRVVKKAPIEYQSMGATPLFSYLELSSQVFETDIVGGLRKKLENDGLITIDTDEEQAQQLIQKWLRNSLIKVTCEPTKKNLPYERSYLVIPFYEKRIGAKSEEHEQIVHYNKFPEITNQISSFLTLFDTEYPKLMKDWTESELLNYVNSTSQQENIEKAIAVDEVKQALPKEEQIVEMVTEEPAIETNVAEDFDVDVDMDFDVSTLDKEDTIVAEAPVEIADEEISFELDDDAFCDDLDSFS